MKRLTSSSNACLRVVFAYQIKDIFTSDLYKEADILTPFLKAYYDKAFIYVLENPQQLQTSGTLHGFASSVSPQQATRNIPPSAVQHGKS